jgi:hypothetical protein
MKIKGVKTIHLDNFPNLLWLRLHTEDGQTGLRETFLGPESVSAYVHETAAHQILGVDDARYNYAPATQDALERTRRIETVCARYNIPLVAAALQFPLGHPNVASVIPGALSPAQVTTNVDAMKVDIPKEFWSDLKNEGILPDHVPTP